MQKVMQQELYESRHQSNSDQRLQDGRPPTYSSTLSHHIDLNQPVHKQMGKGSNHSSSAGSSGNCRRPKSKRRSSGNAGKYMNENQKPQNNVVTKPTTTRRRHSMECIQSKQDSPPRNELKSNAQTPEQHHGSRRRHSMDYVPSQSRSKDKEIVQSERGRRDEKRALSQSERNKSSSSRGVTQNELKSNAQTPEQYHGSRRRSYSMDYVTSQSCSKDKELVQSERGRRDEERALSQSERNKLSSSRGVTQSDKENTESLHRESYHSPTKRVSERRHSMDCVSEEHSSKGTRRQSSGYIQDESCPIRQIQSERGNSYWENTVREQCLSERGIKKGHSIGTIQNNHLLLNRGVHIQSDNSNSREDGIPSAGGFLKGGDLAKTTTSSRGFQRRHSVEHESPNKAMPRDKRRSDREYNPSLSECRKNGPQTITNNQSNFGKETKNQSGRKKTQSWSDSCDGGGGFLQGDDHYTNTTTASHTFKRRHSVEHESHNKVSQVNGDGRQSRMDYTQSQSERGKQDPRKSPDRPSLQKSQSWSNSGKQSQNRSGRVNVVNTSSALPPRSDHGSTDSHQSQSWYEESEFQIENATKSSLNIRYHCESKRERRLKTKSDNRVHRKSQSWSSCGGQSQNLLGGEVQKFFDPRDGLQSQSERHLGDVQTSTSICGGQAKNLLGGEVQKFFDPRDGSQSQSERHLGAVRKSTSISEGEVTSPELDATFKTQSLRPGNSSKDSKIYSDDEELRQSGHHERPSLNQDGSGIKHHEKSTQFEKSSKRVLSSHKKRNESKYLPSVRDWRNKSRSFRQAHSTRMNRASSLSSGIVIQYPETGGEDVPMSEPAYPCEGYPLMHDSKGCISRRFMGKLAKYIPVVLIIVGAGVVLAFVVGGGSGDISAKEGDTEKGRPPSIALDKNVDLFEGKNPDETPKWQFQSGEGLKLEVLNALNPKWDVTFYLALHQWNSGSDVIDLTVTRVQTQASCKEALGFLKVCNGDYGATNWRGLNEVLMKDGYIIASVARMNEYYLSTASEARQHYTMCHEFGHGLGLGHTDESYNNTDLGNCMDYTNFPENNMQPNWMNFNTLQQIYGPPPNRRRGMLRSSLNEKLDKIEKASILEESIPEELHKSIEEIRIEFDKEILSSSDKFHVTELHKSKKGASMMVDLDHDYQLVMSALLTD